jgi:hypothetical protein
LAYVASVAKTSPILTLVVDIVIHAAIHGMAMISEHVYSNLIFDNLSIIQDAELMMGQHFLTFLERV